MNYENEIEIMRKMFMDEIEIDIYEYIEKYDNAVEVLLEHSDLTIIKPLMELFYDDCYELSLMEELEEFILTIANRYGKDGFLEIIKNLKYVKEAGEYFGKEALVKMIMWSNNEYLIFLSALPHISQSEREILVSILLKIKEDNAESLKERVDELIKLLS
ncbi:hypothetical protein [Clostridium lundense]|uniref:hypothetical protein n=1 Tax=Clostridium lundense TaxID=319475 RepID=UPI000489C569|nr:hypothetical protein [Clostridium lundense]